MEMILGKCVSVIIPNYNRSGLVNETVRNVIEQSLPPHEVIVIDDGSTDDSVASLQAEFGNHIQLIQQSNQGPGAARNAGLDIATGEFVWLMDSDDVASLNKLETQVDALVKKEADVVYSPWARVFLEGSTLTLDGPVLQQRAVPSTRSELEWFLTDWSLVLQQCLFRREKLNQAGRYLLDLRNGEDGEYFVRVLLSDSKIVFDDRSLTIYRCDDHGKLTGGGCNPSVRVRDWAKCLLEMHKQTVKFNKHIVGHPEFQQRIWASIQELRARCPDESALIAELTSRVQGNGLAFRALRTRVRKAIRTRVRKTHWSSAFQTGSLTAKQKQLVEQLGYSVV